MRSKLSFLLCGVAIVAVAAGAGFTLAPHLWSNEEKAALSALWIGNLEPLSPDPTNAVGDDPSAAELGQELFFDPSLSSNGAVSCSTCHAPEKMFTDGLPLSRGVGTTGRKAMTLVGAAYSPWFFWDGRKDSQWSQALGPLESPVEHGGNRSMYARIVATKYRAEYEAIFGPMPDLSDAARFPASAGPVDDPAARAAWDAMTEADRDAISGINANIGKAIAAYERRIKPGGARFDDYVQAVQTNNLPGMLTTLTGDEVAGLRIFIGKGECTKCHNGPLLTNNDFHNTGVPQRAGLPADSGRLLGVQQVLRDEFNCLSKYSDAPNTCDELRYAKVGDHTTERAFKPPTLRNVAESGPYMHAGQFTSLALVLDHYNRAPAAPEGHTEIHPLRLSHRELGYLEAFLRTLSGPLNVPKSLLSPPVRTAR